MRTLFQEPCLPLTLRTPAGRAEPLPLKLPLIGNPNKTPSSMKIPLPAWMMVGGITCNDALGGVIGVGPVRVHHLRPVRLPFVAELLATELNSGCEIWGETTNLSRGGCYVRTRQSFPQDTLLFIEIRRNGVSFVTDARVAYTLEHEGMGVSFLNIPANQLQTLEDWLSSAVEK